MTNTSRCIVVLGVHGSGTSAVAGSLHDLGISMGSSVVGPNEHNPKGHFEDKKLRSWLNRIYLSSAFDPPPLHSQTGQKYTETFAKYLLDRAQNNLIWGIKHPELCGKLDLIAEYLPDWRVICLERHCIASVKSASIKWNKKDLSQILDEHNTMRECRNLLLQIYNPPVLWINFNNLTKNPEMYVRKIARFAFEGYDPPPEEQLQKAISFIDPSLNHKREGTS